MVILVAACGIGCERDHERSDSDENNQPNLNPDNFVAAITNPYLPLTLGKTFHYQGTGADSLVTNDVSVTFVTKTIQGVTCVVVWDRVWDDTDLVEETCDWYAQDINGNVWYFGEDSKQFQNGVLVGSEGSWEAGVDDAQAGIVMEGNPQVGDTYRQEYLEGVAEDMAQVLSLSDSATVPYGTFLNCLKTKDWSAIEPEVIENKYFAPNVGEIMSTTIAGGSETMVLVSVTTP
jgi:hypothetical protein